VAGNPPSHAADSPLLWSLATRSAYPYSRRTVLWALPDSTASNPRPYSMSKPAALNRPQSGLTPGCSSRLIRTACSVSFFWGLLFSVNTWLPRLIGTSRSNRFLRSRLCRPHSLIAFRRILFNSHSESLLSCRSYPTPYSNDLLPDKCQSEANNFAAEWK
jgi:hypothetical protein